jgi:D-lactate dehydrogenase
MDVVFYEVFEEEQKVIKKHLDRRIKAGFRSQTIQESGDRFPGAELICIRTQSIIPKNWKNVKAVLTRSQGYDHVLEWLDRRGSAKRGGHLQNYCARAVAEQAAFLMLMLMRKAKKQMDQFGEFNREGLTGVECCGKTACVVGVGHIGREIVDVLKGLRMRVCGVDKIKRLRGFDYVSLENGVERADVLLCALPLTDETDGLLNGRILSKNKKGLFLINVARAEITPAKDLKRLLGTGRIKALALDVFEDEPQLAVHLRKGKGRLSGVNRTLLGLKDADNVIFTPHNAFNSEEALNEKAKQTARAVETYLRRGRFPVEIAIK